MDKNKIAISIVSVAIVVIAIFSYNFKNNTATKNVIEGYVRKVELDENKILICCDVDDVSKEGYLGDYNIHIDKNTVISEGRSINSIEQGEHVIVTYIGTVAETAPAEIAGTIISVQCIE